MVEPVSLPTIGDQSDDTGVVLPSPVGNLNPLPPEVAQQRATKADMGGLTAVLGKTSDELAAQFAKGNEDEVRWQAAAALDLQNMKDKQVKLQDMAQRYGPLSAQQVSQFMDPFAPHNQPTDPDTVIEKQYAKSVIGQLATAPAFLATDNIMDVAAREIPQQASEADAIANDLTTKNQYLLKRLQDAAQLVGGQSTIGYLVDQLKGLSQLYPEYKELHLVPGSDFKLGSGQNMEEQSNTLYRKPQADFKNTVDSIYNYLKDDNPSLLVSVLGNLHGQDTFEKTLNNIYTAMAIPDLALGGKLLKKVLTYNQINKAARDIVSAAAKENPPSQAHLVAAAGDTQESAVLTVARQTADAMAGNANPLQTSHDTLLTGWKTMDGNYRENPGTFMSREAQTRYADETSKQGPQFIQLVSTMNRVERNPRYAAEEVIRAYKDKVRSDFKGPDAMVLDVDGPHIEPVSNTKWFKVTTGDYDGSLFADAETAEGRRAGPMGLGNVAGEAPDKVYVPASVFEHTHSETGIKVPSRTSVSVKEGKVEVIRHEPTYKFDEHGATKGVPNWNDLYPTQIQTVPTPRPGYIGISTKTGKVDEHAVTGPVNSVQQQGLGFYIEHWVPMQETNDVMRDLQIKNTKGEIIPETVGTGSSSGTKSIINSVLGWVRNSEDTLSRQESAQRLAVTYSKSNIEQWAAGLNKPINRILGKATWWKPTSWIGKLTPRDVRSQFERALKNAQQTQEWFKGPAQLQDFYMRNFSRNPSPLETEAYFNYVKLVEGDRMLGEIAEFRNRARVGAEQHKIKFIGPDGKPIYSDLFDGVTLTHLPKNEDQVYITGDVNGKGGRIQSTERLNKKSSEYIQDAIDKGTGKLVEVYDLDHKPLDNLNNVTSGQRIRYVFSSNIESSPLEFNHVNKKEGGHFDWDYDHWMKQASMEPQRNGKWIYTGDTTAMPVKSKAEGEAIAKLFNEAHELMKQGKWEDVRPIAQKLGIPYQDFTGWYKAAKDGSRPKFNFNEPMRIVPKGKNILSLDSALQDRYTFKDRGGKSINRFQDGSRTGFANNFKVAYNTERHTDFDFRTVTDVGSKDNPVYQYQPANLVDPLTTMNRALNRAIDSAFMDDYKMYAVEHWLREAEQHLDVKGGIPAIRSAPFWHFNNAEFKSTTPANIKWNLLSNKYKINTFVGIPSKFDTWVHTFTEHLADAAFINYGPEDARTFGQKARTIVPIWLLHHVTDPVDFIRGVTFNFKLGLFNPAQFLVQAQTHALIWSLEPQHGTVGTFGMLLHGWSRINKNPAILRSLDDYYTKLSGFGSRAKPGEFLEAMENLDRTGFEHVAGEYANIAKSYMPTTNFLQGDIARGLKIGQTPFRLGEQSTRITAWYTAFRKFREENPTVAIGNAERNKILQQADLLTVNMSRASSSAINHGVLSMTTQFLTYQIKLAELFWSKRIGETPTQRAMARARMLTGFSLLYGFPNAIGVTGAPISDNLRAHFMDDLGYIPGEKWISSAINEGWPAFQWALISGHGDLQAGNLENFGNRFGSQGWQNVTQFLRSDIPWYLALGGAGATTMSNFIGAGLDPFYQGAMSWARGDTGDQRFTVKSADLIEPLKEISTVNLFTRWWAAINTGKLISKSERYIEDISPLRATYLSILGMNPQDQDDIFVKNGIIKGEEDAQKKAEKEFTKDWQRGIESFHNGDPEQGNNYVRNAMARFAVVGYPGHKILQAMATASKGWESSIDQSDYSYWTRGDQSKQPERLDYFMRRKAMEDKRNAGNQ